MENFVAVRPPDAVESIIASSGFNPPVRLCQTLLIHAWHSRRRA
jgi:tRNA (cmo5U34)-methyltransferase